MLVLTRKVGEGIAIGENVRVIVMQVKGKQVRLGIKADPATAVHREEVFEKIQDENKRAIESNFEFVNQAAGIMDEVSNMASKDGTAELELMNIPKTK